MTGAGVGEIEGQVDFPRGIHERGVFEFEAIGPIPCNRAPDNPAEMGIRFVEAGAELSTALVPQAEGHQPEVRADIDEDGILFGEQGRREAEEIGFELVLYRYKTGETITDVNEGLEREIDSHSLHTAITAQASKNAQQLVPAQPAREALKY